MATDKPLVLLSGLPQQIPDADFVNPGSGVVFPAASVGLPSAYWGSSNTTGFYGPAADQIGMSVTGLPHWVWSTSAMTINHATTGYTVALNAEGVAIFQATRYSTNANASQVSGRKARGTIASPSAVAQNDIVFQQIGSGYGTTGFQLCANIQYIVTEPTPSDTAMGGSYRISVSPLGSVTPSEVARFEPGTGISMFGANPVIDQNRTLIPASSTVAALPAVVSAGMRNVSDLEGGQGTVFGGNALWRNMQNGQVAQNTISGAGVLSKMTGYFNFAQRSVVNNTMQKLSDAGLLTKLLGLWVHAVPTNSTDALLNWITPGTRNAAIIGSPTWTANQGFTGDGSTSLINTGAPVATFGGSQNSFAIGTYIRTAQTGSATAVIGQNSVLSRGFYLQSFTSGALVSRMMDGTNDNYTPPQYTGMFVMSRGAAANFQASVNDAASTTITRTSVALTNRTVCFLGTADSSGSEFSNAQISFSFLATTLSSTDIANLRWILVDYYLVQMGAISADYTVATLPLAGTPPKGSKVYVTDASGPTFTGTLTGGGAIYTPAYTDGTNWRAG